MTVTELVWNQIKISEREVSLAKVLRCGQAFRWKNIDGIWSCALANRVVFLRQVPEGIFYSSLGGTEDSTLAFLEDYLQLSVSAKALYEQWSQVDAHFLKKQQDLQGIRILRQDPWECLVSFICSSNNNVKRISQMCDNLCIHYGDYVASYNGTKYFTFPPPAKLVAPSIEAELRALGFGYRAKYIEKTALLVHLSSTGVADLHALRAADYDTARAALLQFTGVGPKVADCVALMALDKHGVVPVDTHVYQIAKRDYKFKGKGETVTPQINKAVGDFFRDLWGEYAGWAHSVLFTAELKDLGNGVNVKAGEAVKSTKVKKEETFEALTATIRADTRLIAEC
ncbi:hypothetical protein BABINDRAFT_171637 [Babjeviella inositovora NRRL Y-12698]|uniref:DNA-(apurinic or apyrimidinic site) lyase n=1 Tax=Babjeviella inositovora NRRL Y-12698 TaxID=984486 RepID=A0A1E3QNZ7_9ASCO|nr:uncharacterized protein BABINDRAFT_171637 [Babjeviella inositovora NRRL Y-12698]ODQ79405.1 hypothetical protein BABINDRAFT_171637 [Babjeviella inositovora NRRL Y-12698]